MMKLIIAQSFEGENPTVWEEPDSNTMGRILREMTWDEYCSARLEIDGDNYIEAFGSHELGITVIHAENDMRWRARLSSISVAKVIESLQSYAEQDGEWKSRLRWEPVFDETNQFSESISLFRVVNSILIGLVQLLFHRFISIFTGRMRMGSVIMVKDDEPEMMQAIDHALQTLPRFFSALEQKENRCRDFALKVKISEGSNVEHFWLKDIKKKDLHLTGVIDNEPETIRSVSLGQRFPIAQSNISDWGYFQDNVGQGFFTVKALLRNLTKKEREFINEHYGWK